MPQDSRLPELSVDLHPRQSALLIIDLQYFDAHPDHGLGPAIKGGASTDGGAYYFGRIDSVVVPQVRRLASAFRECGGRVVHVVTGPLTQDGADLLPRTRARRREMAKRFPITGEPPGIYPEGSIERAELPGVAPVAGDIVINKLTTSAFNSSGIDQVLRMIGVRAVVFTGVATNNCVESTLRDASDRAYDCILVDDACAAFDRESHEASLRNVRRLFGRVEATADVLGRLGVWEADLSGARA
ncbi:cysteine hydrolase [Actinomadura graeca]|uniref:Cysteine hydrolase n=1 Tax=Actinomadura graeca TaxID=2750812 RepID=A0ABX8QSY1_9ACTN|nr:cysteine hydrolase [Actinomadura graeca]QXJ21084.1 cysteine hydrolase [Actinomadura graeca]